jgi:hypothetical protein
MPKRQKRLALLSYGISGCVAARNASHWRSSPEIIRHSEVGYTDCNLGGDADNRFVGNSPDSAAQATRSG